MAWNPSATEVTTALTDVLLAGVAAWAALRLVRLRSPERWKVRIWILVFGLLALGALIGALIHGFVWPEKVRSSLWTPLYLALALTVALFVVGAIYDARGYAASRRFLVPLLGLAGLFFLITQIGSGNFLWFVLYESLAMLVALGLYGYLSFKGNVPGAPAMATGVLLTMLAAAIQATKKLGWGGPVPVNSDGVFHLVQTVAIFVLVRGLKQSLISPVREGSRSA